MAEEKQKKVKVTLKVAMSEADLGHAAKAGDEVEVDAEQAERWIAAGIAEAAGKAEEPTERKPGSAGLDEKPPSVPRRGAP